MRGPKLTIIFLCTLSLAFAGCNRKAAVDTGAVGAYNGNTGNTGNTGSTGYTGTTGNTGTTGTTGQTANNGYTQTNGVFSWNGQTIQQEQISESTIQVWQQTANQSGLTVSNLVALGPQRCQLMGDSMGNEMVPGTSLMAWQGRMAWARRCHPEYNIWYDIAANALRQDGTTLALYPTFGHVGVDGVPHSTITPKNPADSCSAGLPADIVLLAFCLPGCYSPNQTIYTSQIEGNIRNLSEAQSTSISSAQTAKAANVVTLAPGSSLDNIQLHSSKVDYFMKDLQGADVKTQPFITLRARSGKSLQVTPEHPVVRGDGIMVRAETLAVGDTLLAADGTADTIDSIRREDLALPAHNVAIKGGSDPIQNLVVVKGYINGDLKFQNHEFEWLNRLLLRNSIPASVVEPGN